MQKTPESISEFNEAARRLVDRALGVQHYDDNDPTRPFTLEEDALVQELDAEHADRLPWTPPTVDMIGRAELKAVDALVNPPVEPTIYIKPVQEKFELEPAKPATKSGKPRRLTSKDKNEAYAKFVEDVGRNRYS